MGLKHTDNSVGALMGVSIIHPFLLMINLDDRSYPLLLFFRQRIEHGGGAFRYDIGYASKVTTQITQLLFDSLSDELFRLPLFLDYLKILVSCSFAMCSWFWTAT